MEELRRRYEQNHDDYSVLSSDETGSLPTGPLAPSVSLAPSKGEGPHRSDLAANRKRTSVDSLDRLAR